MINYNESLKQFISDNTDLIDSYKFDLLYNRLNNSSVRLENYSLLTKLLLQIGINPLEHMEIIPPYYAYELDIDTINVPLNCTSIYSHALTLCKLKSIKLHNDITDIHTSAFSQCYNLDNIILPTNSNYTTIAANTFNSCTSLTNIEIPDTITKIERNAFAGCTSLKNVTLPNTITRISNHAFTECDSLKSIFIPDSVTMFRAESFPTTCTILAHKDSNAASLCNIYNLSFQII